MDGEHATIERDGAVRSGHKASHMTAPMQRIEVITRGGRRRRWSIEEKREIIAESLGTGFGRAKSSTSTGSRRDNYTLGASN
jgi:transposase-like protein